MRRLLFILIILISGLTACGKQDGTKTPLDVIPGGEFVNSTDISNTTLNIGGNVKIKIGNTTFQTDIKNETITPIIAPTPQDTDTILNKEGEKITTKAIIQQIAQNMGIKVDVDNDREVQALLDKFSTLSYQDRIKYGVWGIDTEEYKLQQGLK